MITDILSIRHTFTDEERLGLGEEQARLLLKNDELEASLKSAKTQIQSQIDACAAQIRGVSCKLRDRAEFRNLECMVLDHRINGLRHVLRMDTGHIVKIRKLRPHEYQQVLTTEPPRDFIAIALCPVDDSTVGVDAVELRIYDDEFDILRQCPDVKLRDVPATLADKPEKKRKQQPPAEKGDPQ